MSRLPPLNALRAFDAASRHMSFQKAAQELNVTPSALSFQIRQLEEHLQISLFERLNRKVVLTEAGERFAPHIQDGFQRLQHAMQFVTRPQNDNVLTVSAGPAIAAKWLSPRLHRFLELYPDINIRIDANLKRSDFSTDGVDVAIRFGGGNYPDLHVEPLSSEYVTPMVSPSLLARFGGKITYDDLKDITLLHDDSAAFLADVVSWKHWFEAAGVENMDTERGVRFNHADHALDAAIDGMGIVLGRFAFAARDLKSGRIVCPFDLVLPAQAGLYFCCPPHYLELDKVKAFRQFVFDEVAEEQKFIRTIL